MAKDLSAAFRLVIKAYRKNAVAMFENLPSNAAALP